MDKLFTFDHILAFLVLAMLFLVLKGLDRIHEAIKEFHEDYITRTGGDMEDL